MDAARNTAPDDAGAAGNARRPVGEIVFVLALLAIILSIFVQALQLSIFQSDATIGPGFFPIFLSILMMVMVGALMAVLLFGAKQLPAAQEPDAEGGIVTRDQFMLAGLLVLVVLLGDHFGVLAVTGVLLLAGLLFIERVGWRRGILFTLGTLVGVYLVFDLWLGMDVGLRGLLR